METPCDMLLHPELLTNEQLIYIMQQRQLRVANIDRMDRDELLEIFHRFCVPYGQRKYRDSGRGKVLNKSRHMSPERVSCVHSMDYSPSRKSHSNHDRIKPPPDLLTGHMKRIKLDCKMPAKVVDKDSNGFKRKLCIDNMSTANGSPAAKKEKNQSHGLKLCCQNFIKAVI